MFGMIFIILMLMFQPAKAFDERNDFMCVAIFKTAFEQEATKDPTEPLVLRFYSDRVKLLRWALFPLGGTNYEMIRFNNFVPRYMKELDTATALLHLSRCESRIHEIFAEYKASR